MGLQRMKMCILPQYFGEFMQHTIFLASIFLYLSIWSRSDIRFDVRG
jgi:hypothetical protein